jgi:hypothetical protein
MGRMYCVNVRIIVTLFDCALHWNVQAYTFILPCFGCP